MHFLSWNRTAK